MRIRSLTHALESKQGCCEGSHFITATYVSYKVLTAHGPMLPPVCISCLTWSTLGGLELDDPPNIMELTPCPMTDPAIDPAIDAPIMPIMDGPAEGAPPIAGGAPGACAAGAAEVGAAGGGRAAGAGGRAALVCIPRETSSIG